MFYITLLTGEVLHSYILFIIIGSRLHRILSVDKTGEYSCLVVPAGTSK